MIIAHNQPGEILSCDLCEFETSRKSSLSIHMSKKHKQIDQLDTYSEEYWEKDNMGPT